MIEFVDSSDIGSFGFGLGCCQTLRGRPVLKVQLADKELLLSLQQGAGSQACRNPKPTRQSTKAGLPATSMGTCSQAAMHAQPIRGRR
jgi:hypothetical protein